MEGEAEECEWARERIQGPPYGEREVREGGGTSVPGMHVEIGSKQDLRVGVYPIPHVTTHSIAVPQITHLVTHRMTAECIFLERTLPKPIIHTAILMTLGAFVSALEDVSFGLYSRSTLPHIPHKMSHILPSFLQSFRSPQPPEIRH